MPAAPWPQDETERLRALRNTGLLESGTDPVLDTIVRRAATLFGAPIAVVSLLDDVRQNFKASVGVGVHHTRREMAFCGYVILGSDPLVVLDAHRDARFSDNAMVVGAPGVRFYVGAPVYSVGGQKLGALCVIDTAARDAVAPVLVDDLLRLAADVSKQFARSATARETTSSL